MLIIIRFCSPQISAKTSQIFFCGNEETNAFAVANTSPKISGGGGSEIFNMYAFGVRLGYANLSNIMLGISNSLFDYCNVTITLYAYILVCVLVPLASKQRKV